MTRHPITNRDITPVDAYKAMAEIEHQLELLAENLDLLRRDEKMDGYLINHVAWFGARLYNHHLKQLDEVRR